jgi:Right handed beta helix region/Bacterial Ig-like domain (group 3)
MQTRWRGMAAVVGLGTALVACGTHADARTPPDGGVEAATSSVLEVPAAYPTIQQAITAAVNGDTVLVAPGTYHERLVMGGKIIQVRSTDGPEVTIVDADFLGPVVKIGSGATRASVIEGFTLTRGKDQFDAGGVQVSSGSPTIRGNIVTANRGGDGNGISLDASSALIESNVITNNVNSGDLNGGGGGGGIYVGSYACTSPSVICGAEIRGNLIQGNQVLHLSSGGGIAVNGGGPIKIIGNEIRGNQALSEGAGIDFINSNDAQVENNLIVDNVLTQGGQGGGIYWGVPNGSRGPFVVNNTIVNNSASQGSGIYAAGFDVASRVVNNLIVAAPGSSGIECEGMYDNAPPAVRNNDVVATANAYAGLCAGAAGTVGNLSVAPAFVGIDDYHLAPGSAGIDAGSNADSTQALDLGDTPRLIDGDNDGSARVDMGAFETKKATELSLATSGTPAGVGGTVTFTAVLGNAADASGSVTFCADVSAPDAACSGGGVLCAVPASAAPLLCATSALAAGEHAISAFYGGDATHAGSMSATLTQQVMYVSAVSLAQKTTVLGTRMTVSLQASVSGQQPTGTVGFFDDDVPLTGCDAVPLSALARLCTVNLPRGTHHFTASYSGDSANLPGISAVLIVVR